MAAVYVSNIIINSGTDFSQTFTLEGASDNSPLILVGYTVTSQMRKYQGSSTAIDFTTSIVQPASLGKIIISLTAAETTVIKPGRYLYDILLTDSFLVKTRVIEGSVLVREGVTR
jgi:hypothetical protein